MTTLAQYERARAALAEATRVDEVLHVRDEIEHIKLHARQIEDRTLLAEATTFQMRVERRLGVLLIAAKESGQIAEGRRWPAKPAESENENNCAEAEQLQRLTLAEVGVSRKLSAKAQQAASISEQAFEAMVHAMRERIAAGKPIVVNQVGEEEQRRSRRELAQALSDTSAQMSTGRKFPVIYADPAWRRKAGIGDRAYENHYPTMTWDEIMALPVRDILLADGWVFLWMPRAHLMALHPVKMEVQVEGTGELMPTTVDLPLAWAIARVWGCDDWSTCFVWTKTDDEHPNDQGLGLVVRDQDEILCLFKRGKGLPKPSSKEKFGSNHRERSKPLGHSRKPEHYRHMIAIMCGGLPVCELFARVDDEHPLPTGWSAWGNQSASVNNSNLPSNLIVAGRAAASFCPESTNPAAATDTAPEQPEQSEGVANGAIKEIAVAHGCTAQPAADAAELPAASATNTPEASGTAREAPGGPLLGGPSDVQRMERKPSGVSDAAGEAEHSSRLVLHPGEDFLDLPDFLRRDEENVSPIMRVGGPR